jgi:sortase A
LLLTFIFLIGLSILLYPLVSSTWNQIIQNISIGDYEETVENTDPKTLTSYIEAARDYNIRLQPKAVPDAFSIRSEQKDTEYESLLKLTENGCMGYVEIPVIKVSSPIYHYTTKEVLERGVGHLFGSSLPVSGKGTHAVITAHRGLPHNKLFSDLDKVKLGDKFYITTCGETFAYQVDQIKVVEPVQTEDLALNPEKDYVTLVTCTPYGVNTHRILCRGHNIPYVPGEEDQTAARRWLNMNILTGLIGALIGILLALIMIIRLKKRGNNIEQGTETKQEKKDPKIRFRRVK